MLDRIGAKLTWIDALIVGLYFLAILLVGLWTSRGSSRKSVGGYFLASRNMHWIPVGASLFASNIGTVHFIGLAGAGAASGIAVAGFELIGPFTLILLGWLFVPVYLSSRIFTLPEYLQKRFGGQRIRIYLSVLSLLITTTTKLSVDLFAGALFIQMALGRTSALWLYVGIVILLAISALFTITGGLTAVIWTDFVQTILIIVGSFVLMIYAFYEVGGYQELIAKFPFAMADNTTTGVCGRPPDDYMNLLRSPLPGVSDYPWTGMVFGLMINAVWYFCTDQVMVQRTLASRNIIHAKKGCILASYLKLLPLFLMVLPGMAARVLFPDEVGCSNPDDCENICGIRSGCSNTAYMQLVLRILPTGLTGAMLAVMLAALMSSLTSVFNSASTIFTVDIWSRFRTKASDRELIIVGKIIIAILSIIAILWVPIIRSSPNSKMFDYIQSIVAFLAPPICAVYIMAIFWSRTTEQGAFWGLMGGLFFGLVRLFLELSFPGGSCGQANPRPLIIQYIVDNVHYLHFACLQFLWAGSITIMISLLTKPIPQECLYRLTYWTRYSKESRISVDDMKQNKIVNMEFMGKSVTPKMDGMNKEDETIQELDQFLVEEPKEKLIVNIQAAVCIAVTIFVIAFYA